MSVLWKIVFVLFVFKVVDVVYGDCLLSLNKDFGNPQPVLIKDGVFLAPNTRNGSMLIRRSKIVTVACTGDKRHIVLSNATTGNDVLEARCESGQTFTIGQWRGLLKDVQCNVHPWFTAEDTGNGCYGANSLYRVGYKVRSEFHELYQACFDSDSLRTLYVKHRLSPSSAYTQVGGSRPQFIEGDLFGKIRLSNLYKMKTQKQRFQQLLGEGQDAVYITKNQFLTRGHLAARADFPFMAAQRASFHYVNAAPQWRRGNAGDWAALEEALRRRIKAYNSTVTIYTGTYGVSTLPDHKGIDILLYLDVDSNNNGLVPVPMYFYKLVYDPRKKAATAFILINSSSFYNSSKIKELTFCEDICQENKNFNWLKWRGNDGTHSFCCSYDDFAHTVKDLSELNVNGLFY